MAKCRTEQTLRVCGKSAARTSVSAPTVSARSGQEVRRRYVFFLCSVFVNAFGIALITKAQLGTSPISSVPYVLSLFTAPTMGVYTILMNFLFILLELTMMKRQEIRENRRDLLAQVPVIVLFGSFIDVSMHILGQLVPTSYPAQLLTLAAGCLILGAGISMEVKADVSMVTGEYLVRVISKFARKDFGIVKMCFDAALTAISCTLSLIFMHGIEGVREGTVLAALAVGPISRALLPLLRVFDGWLRYAPKEK